MSNIKVGSYNCLETGKRKRAIAKVYLYKKCDAVVSITINGVDFVDYFKSKDLCSVVMNPFDLLKLDRGFVFNVSVKGGGLAAQADAIKLGISRVLAEFDEEFSVLLRKNNFLTRDSRVVERKKSGLRKARKSEQFSKR